LISKAGPNLEEYMAAVTKCGEQYGLQVHWGKVHLVPVCTTQTVRDPSGDRIPPQESLLYLGSTIRGNGKFGCEIARKVGAASATFKALQSVWKHASISTARKLKLFEALVQSKLRYAVASAWLLKSDLRRIDGFQAACLRKILKIPSAFYSRISNQRVREQSGLQQLALTVRRLQLRLLGQVLTNPSKKHLRTVAFQADTVVPLTDAFIRRVGRPRQNWTDQLMSMMQKAAGHDWRETLTSQRRWLEVSTRVI